MSFSDHKIDQFTHRIADLPDQPNMLADELKARFDSSPEELRKSLNAVCDDAQTLSNKVDSIITQTFEWVVDKSMLAESLADELDAKATQTALTAEQTARESADSSLDSRVSTAESTISTHTTQIAQKCQIYCGAYTGTTADSRTISLGFRPKAVLLFLEGKQTLAGSDPVGGLIMDGYPIKENGTIVAEIVQNGFTVCTNSDAMMNYNGRQTFYLAFR